MTLMKALQACVVMLIWGTNFVAIKAIVASLPPLFALGLRFLVVGGLIVPTALRYRSRWRHFVVLALCMGVGHFMTLFIAIAQLDAGLAAILMQTQVMFLALLGVFYCRERLTQNLVLSLIFGFGGVVLLYYQELHLQGNSFLGINLVLFSALMWAFSNVYIKTRLANVPAFSLTGWIALFSSIPLLLTSFVTENINLELIKSAPIQVWGGLAYAVFGSSFLAYFLWFRLLKRCPMTKLANFLFLIPVFALITSSFIFNEKITMIKMIGALLIIVAMFCSNRAAASESDSSLQ